MKDHLWDAQKWSLRPLLDTAKSGLDSGILLYMDSDKKNFAVQRYNVFDLITALCA